jgi:hypothetical protein
MMAGMTTLILTGLLRVLKTRRALVLENLALQHQLAVLQRAAPRPRLRPADRLFWVLLYRTWSGWADVLSLVKPVGCHPVASDRLHAVLDLEEPTNRSRPPGPLP